MIKCIDSKSHTIGLKDSAIAKQEFILLDDLDKLAIYLNWKIDNFFNTNAYVPKLTFHQFNEHHNLMGRLSFNEYLWHFHRTDL